MSDVSRRLQPSDWGAVFGSFAAGRLVGMLGVQREAMRKLGHKAFIWGMYVAPEHRLGGHGARLLRQALSHAWHVLGVAQVNLGVHVDNTAAIGLYRRFGFEVWGTERGSLKVDGAMQDEHHMVCHAPGTA